MSFRKKIIAATPFLCLMAFLTIGMSEGVWHPTWMIFLLIPLISTIVGQKSFRASYPTIVLIAFLIIGFEESWTYNWMLFLTIPLFYIFFPKKGIKEKAKEKKPYGKKIYMDDIEEVNYVYHGE